MINLNHLRSFYFCALHKNVTHAAKSLGISQPSLSQQIKAFEEEIGLDLFYRNGRNLDLTPKGRGLYLRAESIFSSVAGVVDFIENQSEIRRTISIGVTDQIERPFVAKLTLQLTNESVFKNSKLSVLSDSIEVQKALLDKSLFDILLSHEEIKTLTPIHVFEFPVKLISKKPSHAVSNIKQINLSSLLNGLGEKLVLPAKGLRLRSEIESYLSKTQFDGEVIFESNILGCLAEVIRSGIGCGFLPIVYVYEDIKKNKLSIFGPENGFWKHKMFLYAPKTQDSVVTKEFIKAVQNFSIQKGG